MNIEAAYETIAVCAQSEAGSTPWDSLLVEMKIYFKMAEIVHWVKQGDKKIQGNGSAGFDMSMKQLKAALFLRDNLIQTGGGRIWGLVFTLYPSGKFTIEYDYNKPEGYEETDELISGEEINQSLNKLSS